MIRRETSTGRGAQDRDRYAEKIRERIRSALPTIPGQIPVITGPGDQPVTVPIPGGGIGLPRFVPKRSHEPPKGWGQGDGQPGDIVDVRPVDRGGGTGTDAGRSPGDHDIAITLTLDEWRQWILDDLKLPYLTPKPTDQIRDQRRVWSSRSRTGSLSAVDKRMTLKEALARSQAARAPLTIHPDDVRYQSWVDRPEPQTAAVIAFCRDISASMDGERQYLARALAFALAAAIQRAYPECQYRFWVHDTDPYPVEEAEFLQREAGGGTLAEPAYAMMQATLDREFPSARYHRYVFHFTDGEIGDPVATLARILDWAPTLTRLGIVLVRDGARTSGGSWLDRLNAFHQEAVRIVRASRRDMVPQALRQLLEERGP
ncbi:MAG: DUF444 family protein [Firmicutes bacterium]|nr:DUF444 family protein [Bacillota bacterium]